MSAVTATRSELLARKSREGIAQRGHTLLTQKRLPWSLSSAGSGSKSVTSVPS